MAGKQSICYKEAALTTLPVSLKIKGTQQACHLPLFHLKKYFQKQNIKLGYFPQLTQEQLVKLNNSRLPSGTVNFRKYHPS